MGHADVAEVALCSCQVVSYQVHTARAGGHPHTAQTPHNHLGTAAAVKSINEVPVVALITGGIVGAI